MKMKKQRRIPSPYLKPTEPTIWALRKPLRANDDTSPEATLYEHIFGYDPIRLPGTPTATEAHEEEIHKGSGENPHLNIINPATNFMVKNMTSD